jgi:drug/metabolite transporter (DMT)-like permease
MLLLVLVAVLWSSGGVLIKLVQWNAPAIAATRSVIAALFIGVLYARRMNWSFQNRHALRLTLSVAGVYAATVMLFVMATKLTTAANAILLQYTAPIHVALFSAWFLGERITRFDWFIIAIVVAGMGLFFLDGLSAAGMLGNVLAIGSGMAFAWLTLLARKQSQALQDGQTESASTDVVAQSLQSLLLGNILTACVGAPFALSSLGEVSLQGWLGLLALGVVQLGISYVLYVQAIQHVSALEAILIPVVEPLLNPVWVVLLTGERPGVWAFVGGMVVIAAITTRSVLALKGAESQAEQTS